jgi:hypothetical protein
MFKIPLRYFHNISSLSGKLKHELNTPNILRVIGTGHMSTTPKIMMVVDYRVVNDMLIT